MGKGAEYKDTCHPERSADEDVKRGSRWRMHPGSLLEDANEEFSVLQRRKHLALWFQGRDHSSSWVYEHLHLPSRSGWG